MFKIVCWCWILFFYLFICFFLEFQQHNYIIHRLTNLAISHYSLVSPTTILVLPTTILVTRPTRSKVNLPNRPCLMLLRHSILMKRIRWFPDQSENRNHFRNRRNPIIQQMAIMQRVHSYKILTNLMLKKNSFDNQLDSW